jgi:hypothetical protein
MRNHAGQKVIANSVRAVSKVLALMAIATLPVSAGTITFTDNFTPSASPLWNNYAGNWTTSSGTYFAQVPNNNPLTFTGVPFDLTDFGVTVTVNNLGDGGIWLRGDDTNRNGVLLVTGGNGYGQGGRGDSAGNSLYWTVIQNGDCPPSCPELDMVTGVFTPGGTYTITVVVTDDKYSAFIDGSSSPATTLIDSTFSSGHVGLYDTQPNTTTGSGFGPPQSFSNFSLQGSTVPEPGTLLLFASGLVSLAWAQRMRKPSA